MRLLAGHQVDVAHRLTGVARQRRGPNKASGSIAEQVENGSRRSRFHWRQLAENQFLAPAVTGLVEVELRAAGRKIDDVAGTGAVDVSKPNAAAIKEIRGLEPGSVVHGDLRTEVAIAKVGPIAHLAIADANQVGQPVPRQIRDEDGLGAVGKDQLRTLLFVDRLLNPLLGSEPFPRK